MGFREGWRFVICSAIIFNKIIVHKSSQDTGWVSVMGLKIHFCHQCSRVLSFKHRAHRVVMKVCKNVKKYTKTDNLAALGDGDLQCTAFGKTFHRR